MTKTTQTLPTETGGTDITRSNALSRGVLSRYTVLPWESTDEYRAVVEALVAEQPDRGAHLVEEIAGILWRKRRLPAPSAFPPGDTCTRNTSLTGRPAQQSE